MARRLLLLAPFPLSVAGWATVAVLYSVGYLSEPAAIFGFTIACALQAMLLAVVASGYHRYTLSAPSLFLLSSVLFLSVMPLIATLVGYHFVMQAPEEVGTSRLVALNFWLITVYVLIYLAIIREGQRSEQDASPKISGRDAQVMSRLLRVGGFVGLLAFGTVFLQVVSITSLSYTEIGELLRGENWRIRVAELLPTAGVAIYLIGAATGSRLKVLGFAMISTYAVLRAPFQNRENVVKFFVILVIALQLQVRRKTRVAVSLSLGFVILGFLFALPFLSALRGGRGADQLVAEYGYFVFRDLNFAEIPGALMADPSLSGEVGVEDGLKITIGTLVPRRLWPAKPYPVAVRVTSWITPVAGYDVKAPVFAYAPTYVGFAYVIGGWLAAIVLAGAVAAAVAITVRSLGGQGRRTWPIDNTITAIVVYYGAFAVVKLDPANILAAAVLPLSFLMLVRVVGQVRLRASTLAIPGTESSSDVAAAEA